MCTDEFYISEVTPEQDFIALDPETGKLVIEPAEGMVNVGKFKVNITRVTQDGYETTTTVRVITEPVEDNGEIY